MSIYKTVGTLGIIVLLVTGCKKEIDPLTVANDIELTENPDPVKRISGTYNAVKVDAAFKQSDGGSNSYSEGNYALAEPDNSIQGGGYKLTVTPAGGSTVTVSLEGYSTNFANVPQTTVGTYTVFTTINGSVTEYVLRKSLNGPKAIEIKRYDYNSKVQGFEYDVTFYYHVNKSTGAIHLGNQDEIEPLPTSWFFLSGDFYTTYFKMIRRTSLS